MDEQTTAWLSDLERRHLADLTTSEVARALRALSSCYVERRSKLASGEALGSRGKRAAFALFYGPVHFWITREIARSLNVSPLHEIVDLGCGTGAAGIAWATVAGATRMRGFDRHPWAVDEANTAYKLFRLDGRAIRRDLSARGARPMTSPGQGTGILAAYAINELDGAARGAWLPDLLSSRKSGARVLVVEPIARRTTPWWDEWARAFEAAGGRSDEWRFPATLPPTQQQLARAAGLDPREFTARSLFV
jgi:hypothetical protein